MPPKKQPKPPKAEVAKKQKVADDKTFGLKNKNKSAKVQQYVQQVQKNIKAADKPRQDAVIAKKTKKEAEEQRQKELNELFAEAIKQPKVPVGVDPKSIVCEYFRHNRCSKGFKCKFSHDLSVERKGGKIDLYTERRDGPAAEDMDEWDKDKLEDVVKQKHGAEKPNRTTIICKYFLDAVEKRLYGWFWQCPNGKDCQYRHALPPGYVLKSQMKELLEEEAANKKSIEDVIEEERAKVDARTPITQTVFADWRRRQQEERQRAAAEGEAERRRRGVMTGREIFAQEGFVLDDDVGATDDFTRENDDEEEFLRARRKADEEIARQRATQSGAAEPSPATAGPSDAPPANGRPGGLHGAAAAPGGKHLSREDEALFDDDDDDDDDDDISEGELDALEATLEATHVGGGA